MSITAAATYAADLTEWVETVPYRIEAQEVRVGDRFADTGKLVLSASRGPEWTKFEVEDDNGGRDRAPKVIRRRNAADVAVTRREATPESTVIQNRQRNNRRLAEHIESSAGRLAAALAGVNNAVQEHGYAEYNRLETLMAAQANSRVIGDLVAIAESGAVVDLVEAAERMTQQYTRDLTSTNRHRAFSKSTSVIGNVMEEALSAAKAEFLDSARWGY